MKPEAPGWYWFRSIGFKQHMPLLIDWVSSSRTGEKELFVYFVTFPGHADTAQPLADFGGDWFGRCFEPQELIEKQWP